MLRYARITISAAVWALLTCSLTWPGLAIEPVARWFSGVQLGTAVSLYAVGVLAVWLAVTLLLGRVYCSTVCPVGTLLDGSAHILRRSIRGRQHYRYVPQSAMVRYLFLILVAAAMLFGLGFITAWLDPYSAYERICTGTFRPLAHAVVALFGYSSKAEGLTVSVASSVLATLMVVALAVSAGLCGRRVCNTICPVGTLLGAVSRVALWHIEIDPDRCTHCGLCADACKGECIDATVCSVDASRCVVCFDCLKACPNAGAISYTTRRSTLSTPMMQKTPSFTISKPTSPSTTANATISRPSATHTHQRHKKE